ncbi:sigma-54-dependent Fis family transcriptional regulator [Prauserella oleivorans]|uniref:Sigma-54-dependent Fis family transcriptional regulator n=1 Tax=Prauserella oleivorans TaxID=1478153 RepID=A0ABW5WDJ6_9PSEU
MTDPVVAAREELVRAGLRSEVHVDGVVPDRILRSWRRSISSGVATEGVNERFRDINVESRLVRSATPVLERWQHKLADTETSLLLCDRAGSVLARLSSDRSVLRHLDRLHVAPGYDSSEESIGTNGLGTAIAEATPVCVQGSQHYKTALAGLTCAAVPIMAPSGSVAGAISLNGPAASTTDFMLCVAREIGNQIEDCLRASSRPQDLALALSFMRYTNSSRPTVVIDEQSMLANTPALPYVSVGTHVLLWETLNAEDWKREGARRLRLDEVPAEVLARRVLAGPKVHFVLHFDDRTEPTPPDAHASAAGDAVVASARRAVRDLAKEVIVVEGPRGSGRATVARRLHRDRSAGALHEFVVTPGVGPAWSRMARLLDAGCDVLLRRTERLCASDVADLRDLVDRRPGAGVRRGTLVLTACVAESEPELRAVVERIGPEVRLEALSHTPERIPGLVEQVLESLPAEHRRAISPAALQALMQWRWPGDLAELVETITTLAGETPGPVIQRRDLPPHLRQESPRRELSLLEEAEREAIIRALHTAGGNKSRAADLLGIGRSTLYRRLRRLKLDTDEGSL